jgi:acyl CoA:acetate/3-ketoacid CoA transferase alpha subunit
MLRRPSIIRIIGYNSKNGPQQPPPHRWTKRTLFQPPKPPAAATVGTAAPKTTNDNGRYCIPTNDNTGLYCIPHHQRLKVITAEDAASLVHDFDTVTCSGFVSQGAPEAILQALGRRYQTSGHPHSLTLLFGGGPGDWQSRGLNHLGQTTTTTTTVDDGKTNEETSNQKNETTIPPPSPPSSPPMLFRTIGSHYGQVPKVAQLALDEITEAWALPMGSICRMIRAQATHAPGHLTNVGLGTYVDPSVGNGGGAALNEKARKSSLDLVTKLTVRGESLLLYKALPIQVAIIRGTTADAQGNISLEHESLVSYFVLFVGVSGACLLSASLTLFFVFLSFLLLSHKNTNKQHTVDRSTSHGRGGEKFGRCRYRPSQALGRGRVFAPA